MDEHLDNGVGGDPEVVELATRLSRERPLPAPAFRGNLRRRLETMDAPLPRLWRRAFRLAAAGTGCLGVAATGALGVGPLA